MLVNVETRKRSLTLRLRNLTPSKPFPFFSQYIDYNSAIFQSFCIIITAYDCTVSFCIQLNTINYRYDMLKCKIMINFENK